MKIKNGVTRKVIIIGGYAFKIPQTRYGWQRFLNGLLANIQERYMSTIADVRLCPVVFSIPGGWLNVMPACDELSESEFDLFNPKAYCEDLPVENKRCSFGWYMDHDTRSAIIVAVDYGS